jgi:hypothetical protein
MTNANTDYIDPANLMHDIPALEKHIERLKEDVFVHHTESEMELEYAIDALRVARGEA